MRRIISLLILFTTSTSRGQLNYEGNPLTENTEYTAEESHYSKRNDAGLLAEIIDRSAKAIDSYGVASNNAIYDGEAKKSVGKPMSFDIIPENIQSMQSNNNVHLNPPLNFQVPPITFLKSISNGQIKSTNTHTSNHHGDNENDNQIITSRQMATSHSSNEALNYFLKSQTPQESQLTLDNYLRIHNQNDRLSGQLGKTKQDNKQNFISSLKNMNQKELPSDNLSSRESVGGPALNPEIYPHDQQIYGIYPLSSGGVWQQPPIQNRHDFIPVGPRQRRPLYHYYGPAAGRPHRSRQRLQTRIGHYPPTLFTDGGSGGKSSGDIIFTRPPGFHGPPASPTSISTPHIPYDDASAHFPISNHPPLPKDIYYSQLYSQSYDPHYYNYIAKTGKVKPWLYGKLGPKEESGFWNELLHSFKNHGMKNMMNPMFLLGLSIPAVTLMLSAMVNKRSFNGRSARDFSSSDWAWSEKDLDKMHANLLSTLQCMNEQKVKGKDPTECVAR